MKDPAEVVLVHGLWFGPWAMGRLARNLESHGFGVRHFRYRSTAAPLDRHVRRLHAFCAEREAGRRHLVGHSLGGLVALTMLAEYGQSPPGRVVLLGSPLAGSATARKARKIRLSERLFGQVRPVLETGLPRFPSDCEAGMIAGSRGVGLGLLLGGAGKPGDGTVAVSETRHEALADHLVLPVTHTGMLFSRAVALQAACFLQSGHFERPEHRRA